MKNPLLLSLLLLPGMAAHAQQDAHAAAAARPPLYDVKASGAQQIEKTLAAELKKSYVVVLIDVDKKHNEDINQRYGNPTKHGLPVLVVLDSSGKPLFTQDSGKLEEGDHHDPAKVLAFLKQWAPKR